MSDYVPFAGPAIDDREVAAVTAVLRRGWLSTGPEARELERAVAELVGRRFAVALNSGTAALHLAFAGLGVGPGDEVIVPTVTFTATAAAVVHAGAQPVLVDVEADTMNVSPEAVRRSLGPRTRAVVAVHLAGRVADIAALREVAGAARAHLVEDAAHTLPAYRNGRIAGSFGEVAAFSFFATKPITTAEGGMLVTDDPRVEERARLLSRHGISREAVDRYAPGGSAHYEVLHAGYKYNLSDLQAALGRVQLAKHEQLWQRRRAVAGTYQRHLADLDQLELPPGDTPHDLSSWYLYIIRLRLERLRVDRDGFCARLHEAGVGTSVHFRPLHTYAYYRQHAAEKSGDFPVADQLWPRIVSLPVHAGMTDEDALRVVEVVRSACAELKR